MWPHLYRRAKGTKALTFNTVATGQNTADLAVTAYTLNGATVGSTGSATGLGQQQTLTDANSHVFSFGKPAGRRLIRYLCDGVRTGALSRGTELELVNGTVWDNTGSWGGNSRNGTCSWIYQGNAPALSGGVTADLSGAATNPAGVLQIDTTTSDVSALPR